MSRYILVPMGEGDVVNVSIPKGLVCNIMYDELQDKVTDKPKLKMLLEKLACNQITESEDGRILRKEGKVSDIILREALIDTCNMRFFEKYEDFYTILRNIGVTF